MAVTSVKVGKSKVDEVKVILSAASAREAVDRSLQIVIALHQQQRVLEELKSSPLTDLHRMASLVEYYDSAQV